MEETPERDTPHRVTFPAASHCCELTCILHPNQFLLQEPPHLLFVPSLLCSLCIDQTGEVVPSLYPRRGCCASSASYLQY